VLRALLLIVPLAFDTFAVSAALGVGGVRRADRLRLSLLFAGFQAGMPLVGFVLGRALGAAVGDVAEYVAVATLVALGAYMLFEGDQVEAEAAARSARLHGWALVGLGVSVSLDELARRANGRGNAGAARSRPARAAARLKRPTDTSRERGHTLRGIRGSEGAWVKAR